MLLLLLQQQPAPATAFVDAAAIVSDMWPALNAAGEADAVYWTRAELLGYINQAAKQLARRGPFTRYDDSTIVLAAGTPDYALPADQINTVQADLDGLVLRGRTVQELEARDSTWNNTQGSPVAFVQDKNGTRKLTAYPKPTSSGGQVGVMIEVFPPEAAVGSSTISVPQCLREYFYFFALAEARISKETRGQMPEISAWCKSIVTMLDGVIGDYWGAQPGT